MKRVRDTSENAPSDLIYIIDSDDEDELKVESRLLHEPLANQLVACNAEDSRSKVVNMKDFVGNLLARSNTKCGILDVASSATHDGILGSFPSHSTSLLSQQSNFSVAPNTLNHTHHSIKDSTDLCTSLKPETSTSSNQTGSSTQIKSLNCNVFDLTEDGVDFDETSSTATFQSTILKPSRNFHQTNVVHFQTSLSQSPFLTNSHYNSNHASEASKSFRSRSVSIKKSSHHAHNHFLKTPIDITSSEDLDREVESCVNETQASETTLQSLRPPIPKPVNIFLNKLNSGHQHQKIGLSNNPSQHVLEHRSSLPLQLSVTDTCDYTNQPPLSQSTISTQNTLITTLSDKDFSNADAISSDLSNLHSESHMHTAISSPKSSNTPTLNSSSYALQKEPSSSSTSIATISISKKHPIVLNNFCPCQKIVSTPGGTIERVPAALDNVGYITLTPDDLRTWEVVLILDVREKDRDFFQAQIQAQSPDILCEVRQLSVGDFLWAARPPGTRESALDRYIVLDCIVERKTATDLISSIVDKRYDEQKMRLKELGLANNFYIVEGPMVIPKHQAWMSTKSLHTAIVSTQIEFQFNVIKTRGKDHTAHTLRANHRQMVQRFRNAKCGLNFGTLEGFQHRLKKEKVRNAGELFARMMIQLPGVRSSGAVAIQTRFGTLANLMKFLQENDSATAQKEIAQLQVGMKRLGPKTAQILHKMFASEF